MAAKRELWRIQKRLERIEESLFRIKQELSQYYPEEEQRILTQEASIEQMGKALPEERGLYSDKKEQNVNSPEQKKERRLKL